MNSLEQFFHILYHYDLAKEEHRRQGRTSPIESPILTMSFDFPDVDPPIVNAPLFVEVKVLVLHLRTQLSAMIRSCRLPKHVEYSEAGLTANTESNDDMKTNETHSIPFEMVSTQTPPIRLYHNPKHVEYSEAGSTTKTESNDDIETNESNSIPFEMVSTQTPPIRLYHHPKHVEYSEAGLTTNIESNDDMETNESNSIPFEMVSTQTPPIRSCHHPKHLEYSKAGLTTNTFVKITRNLANIVGIDRGLMVCRGCMRQIHHDPEYTSHRDYIAPKKAKKEHVLNNLKIEMVGFNQSETKETSEL
ncbi:13065_t:CDS:2 [Funneliformis geosporum]|uniref:13247_t:CDS:1 n=1 Tax=Funneliformis geosporum TaxID=1117311 RepID=A0A9W4SGW0_9GLOM|nr:13247_t:CDS:2 [Funneliformis geosporum]CAI2181217.1 13065_t:CDS:2 [Funneliformis geosporum]